MFVCQLTKNSCSILASSLISVIHWGENKGSFAYCIYQSAPAEVCIPVEWCTAYINLASPYLNMYPRDSNLTA